MVPRRAGLEEGPELAEVWLAARRAAIPAIPPPAHTDHEVRRWFDQIVLPSLEVWVVGPPGAVSALMVLDGSWVDQLYVRPGETGRGLGTILLEHAKATRDHLLLWAFQSNTGARRFYERHGFRAEATTAGENEEGAPDVRYRWDRPGFTTAAGSPSTSGR